MQCPTDISDTYLSMVRAVHVLLADARDEFLGHLLENGGQHAQPTLAAAGDAYSIGALARAHLPNGSAEPPGEGPAAAQPMELDQAAQADALALSGEPDQVAQADASAQPDQAPGPAQEQALDRDSSRGLSAEPDQDADAQQRGYSAEPSRAESEEPDGDPDQAPRPRAGSGRRPKYVTPVDELDNSDVESAQVGILHTRLQHLSGWLPLASAHIMSSAVHCAWCMPYCMPRYCMLWAESMALLWCGVVWCEQRGMCALPCPLR